MCHRNLLTSELKLNKEIIMLLKKYTTLILLMFLTISMIAQENKKDLTKITKEEVLQMTIEDLSDYDLDELMQLMDIIGASSLEELYELLLNKDVTSASKSAESIFDSPLSTTVLSYDEINASGATSVEEALRLVPGVIVREKTNGNYDVQIRGGQNMPMNNMLLYTENTTTLVMIDGRPVFNYGMGGIQLETLPVSLGELDRIEVVRGPSSALYGPNAVNGVINLITKNIKITSPIVSANLQGGSQASYIGDLSVQKSFNEKIAAGLSYNYEHRNRNTDKIYAIYADDFLDLGSYEQRRRDEEWGRDIETSSLFDNSERSKEKMGINAYLDIKPNDNLIFKLSGGYLNSGAISSSLGDGSTSFITRSSYGYFGNLNSVIYGLNLNASLNNATQDFFQGHTGWKMDHEQYNVDLDYLFKLNKVSIRPGVSYQSTYYDDRNHIDSIGEGFINSRKALRNFAASMRFDYSPIEKMRLVAALRSEKYNVPDKWMPSYQFIASYKITDNNLVRAVYSRANQSTFMVNAYSDYTWDRGELANPNFVYFGGSNSPDMMVMDMLEIGFRTRPSKKVLIDVEAFYNKAKDFSALMPDSMRTVVYANPTTIDPKTTLYTSYRHLDIESKQLGISISADMVLSEKVFVKAHMTYQKTIVDNFQDANRDEIAGLQGAAYVPGMTNDITEYVTYIQSGGALGSSTPPKPSYSSDFQISPSEFKNNIENEAIPSFWGSISLTYKPTNKVTINAQGYYYDKYYLYTQYENNARRKALVAPLGTKDKIEYSGHINGKFLLNTKVNYKLNDNINLFVNGRNILNNETQEFIFMDTIGALYLAGFNVNF